MAFLKCHLAMGSSVFTGVGGGGRFLRLHCNVLASTEVTWRLIGRSQAIFAKSYCVQGMPSSMGGHRRECVPVQCGS